MNDGEPTSKQEPQGKSAGASLEDAFQEFLLAVDTPDAAVLESMVAKYPEHAADLTDFAVEWAMQDLLPDAAVEGTAEDLQSAGVGISSAVARAMDRLHAGIEAQEAQVDPFRGRSAADLKALAAALGLDKTLVAKLRDRRIEAATVPRRLKAALAEQLQVTVEAMKRHLEGPPILSMGASFKARGKPEAAGKESFAQAVESSLLADDKKANLLDLDAGDD